MAKETSRSSVVLGNKIQAAIAKTIQDHLQEASQITSALIVVVDENDKVKEMSIISDEELSTLALMYEDKIKKQVPGELF